MTENFSSRTLWSGTAATLAFLALTAAILALYWFPDAKSLLGLERQHHEAALALISGGDWFDSDLIRPPLQSLVLASLYALFGAHIWLAQALQLALLVGSGILLRSSLLALHVDTRTAAWASIVLTVNPITIAYATFLTPEILLLFLTLAIARLLVAALKHQKGMAVQRALLTSTAAGAVVGLSLLTSDLLRYFWPVLLVPLLRFGPWRLRLACAGGFLLALIVITAPAVYRGWSIAESPVITDSRALSHWLALSDTTRSDMVRDMTGPRTAAYLNSSEKHQDRVEFARAQSRQLAEEQGIFETVVAQLSKQYFRIFDSRTRLSGQVHGPECRGYAGAFKSLSPQINRAVDYTARGWHIAVLVLFALGLAAWPGWRQGWMLLVGAFALYHLSYYGVQQARSNAFIALLPIVSLFGGHLLARIPEFRATRSPLSAWQRGAGLLLAAILVALATLGPVFDRACA